MEWRLADAKNRFSELVNKALSIGPQIVHRRNDTVIVLSEAEYRRLTGKRPTFKQFLMQGESLEELDLERDRSPERDIQL